MKKTISKKTENRFGWIIVFFAVLLLAAGATFITLGTTVYSNRVFPNVYVDTIPLGGMTQEEALTELERNGWNEHTERRLLINSFGNISVEIDPVEAGVIIDAESAVNAAIRFGKNSDPLKQLQQYLLCKKQHVDVHKLNTMLNTAYLEQQIDLLQEQLNHFSPTEDYVFDKEKAELMVFKGKDGLELDRDLLQSKIIDALEEDKEEIAFTVLQQNPTAPDFQAIYDDIYTEMHNAYMQEDEFHTIVEECIGYRFDINAAYELWEQAPIAEWVVVPVEVTEPETTKKAIEETLFRDLLGAVTTKYNNSGENRCSNVRLAASMVNGTVLWP